ncbi:MAG: preprotein translocase subunit YajC [Alphaproteobacteria bacterium]|nr:preprotein translocase subunit YajC [Alphaproteobacteria bacterium]
MFINEAFAASTVASSQVASAGGTFVQLALILLIFYLFLIRPQQKRMRAHFDLVNALKIGDKVVTSSGVYGTVKKLSEKDIDLEIAPNVVIKVERMAVGAVVNPEVKSVQKSENKPDVKKESRTAKKSAPKSVKAKSAKK